MLKKLNMRLFLDSNLMTYIAFFENYLVEGAIGELNASIDFWRDLQGDIPDRRVLNEVEGLKILYKLDESAHFDWLFSDLGIEEILRIRDEAKKRFHYDLLDRLIEHRQDVYDEEGRGIDEAERSELLNVLFPKLARRMQNDALQYCEAGLVEAIYFLTLDLDFISIANAAGGTVIATTVSDLPFIAEHLNRSRVDD